MWSSSRGLRIAGVALALALLPALGACTGLTPVYGPGGLEANQVELAYAAPGSRLEQVIYNDLKLRLGRSVEGAPVLAVSASSSAAGLTNDTIAKPTSQKQMTVTARITLRDGDRTLFSGTRSATADYTTDAQVLSNAQAADDAAERAAHLLADIIRLEVLAALGK